MQFKTLAIALFAAAVTAESLQELISQIPSCAKPCLDSASTKVGCSTTDNKCQCSKIDDLTKEAITCVSTSCSADELVDTTKLSGEICANVAAAAGGAAVSSAISSASAAATSAIGSVIGSATDAASTPTATPGAGNRAVAGLGFAAAIAALAL
ncbi:putative cfem domain-containing protein [Daldinia childiae]|uniref:putative cfem domain-containing protein n=1 Tax=Daldinia childiae TaxID=326645 RepID=UPI001446EDF4|nr:putative cfem domain-containing protein [Daldinia childiae]KAF3058119.1 putative cfem domain-containing protein [Daldinia childiae]